MEEGAEAALGGRAGGVHWHTGSARAVRAGEGRERGHERRRVWVEYIGGLRGRNAQ